MAGEAESHVGRCGQGRFHEKDENDLVRRTGAWKCSVRFDCPRYVVKVNEKSMRKVGDEIFIKVIV